MATGQYLGAGAAKTNLLLRFNNDVTDSSGNARNGVATAITYANGRIASKAAAFDGTTSKVACAGVPNSLTKTISAWLKCSNVSTYNTVCQQRRYASAADWDFWSVELNAGHFKYQEYDDTYTGDEYLTTVAHPTTDWFHMVVTVSGFVYKFYLNGSFVETYTTTQRSLAFTPDNFTLGAASNYTTTLGYMTGTIDEFILENVAWSDIMIKKYFTYSKGRFGI